MAWIRSVTVALAVGLPAVMPAETNVFEAVAHRMRVSAYADVESAYWARGAIVHKDPYSAQYADASFDFGAFGRIGAFAWSVSSLSRKGQAANRRNAYNEVDYVAYYAYSLKLVEGWALETMVGPHWVTLPGYRPHASTIHEWNLGQALRNPYVTPYYLLRRAYRPNDGWCYWEAGLTRAWAIDDRLTLTASGFAELGDGHHFAAQYGPNPHGDGSYAHGLMTLNLVLRLDCALTDHLGLFAFVHQFDVTSGDARDALDANTNPESLKDLTIFGVGVTAKF